MTVADSLCYLLNTKNDNYEVACAGQDGAEHTASLLNSEVERDMLLLGVADIQGLDRCCLFARSQ